MSDSPHPRSSEAPDGAAPPSSDAPRSLRPDPELAALPEPRKPWRRATLVSLGATLILSLALCWGLTSQLDYAFKGGQPAKIGELGQFEPGPQHANTWVHARGALEKSAVGYRRPLDDDRFRLARAAGGSPIWVELREPAGTLAEHFLPPSSFVGRLVPLAKPGLRYRSLTQALADSGQTPPEAGAWLLIDGESPAASRWVFGVFLLLLGFAGFSAWSIFRLLRKVRKTA